MEMSVWLVLSPVDVDTDDEEWDAFLFEYKLKDEENIIFLLDLGKNEVGSA